jgi:gamma-glutamyl-gamma-aminobutyrate hydrolase PuuD
MQLINVALGGTLLADIPLLGNGTICHKGQEDMEHPVHLKTDTLLFQAARCTNAIVNSSHHQAVEQVAAGFRISAASPDGLTEGMEWEDTDAWYCMAVQWHPERMDIIHPLSGGFGKAFVEKVVSRIHEAKQSL